MSIYMLYNYFTIPHHKIDSDRFRNMSGAQAKLYIILWKLANRFSRNEFFQSDKELLHLTGIRDAKTLTKAKKELKRIGLIDYTKRASRRTDYLVFL